MDKIVTLFKSLMGDTEVDKIDEKLAGLPEDQGKLLTKAFDVLKQYQEAMPHDLLGAMRDVLTFGMANVAVAKKEDKDKDKEEDADQDDGIPNEQVEVLKGTITALLKTLNKMLPEDQRLPELEEESDIQKLLKAVEAIGKPKEKVKKEKDKEDDKDDPFAKILTGLKDITDRLAVVEKTSGVKKSVDDDGKEPEEDKGDNDKDADTDADDPNDTGRKLKKSKGIRWNSLVEKTETE